MEIKSKFDHFNINVTNLERSIAFYEKAGFYVDHDEVTDIGRGYVMDDHIMRLDLSGEKRG